MPACPLAPLPARLTLHFEYLTSTVRSLILESMPKANRRIPIPIRGSGGYREPCARTLAYIRCIHRIVELDGCAGMAGIVMGIIGVLAAIVVSLPRWAAHGSG